MKKLLTFLSISVFTLLALSVNAAPIYLNIDNISVAVGDNTTATTSNNTFNNGATIDKVIDAPTADAEEFHNQETHIWFSGGNLELLFDFGQQYDLSMLHFWNYTAENFDVDNIDFTFFDGDNTNVGALSLMPDLGSSPGIRAQDLVLPAPLNVRFITAVLSGSNEQIDFQNIGFTASLSTDRCEIDPTDPICLPVSPASAPTTVFLLLVGLIGMLGRKLKLTRRSSSI